MKAFVMKMRPKQNWSEAPWRWAWSELETIRRIILLFIWWTAEDVPFVWLKSKVKSVRWSKQATPELYRVALMSMTPKLRNPKFIFLFNKLQTRFLIGLAFIVVGVSSQIYTQVGPDGYKYPKPQSRFNDEVVQKVEEPVEVEEPAVSESSLEMMQSFKIDCIPVC